MEPWLEIPLWEKIILYPSQVILSKTLSLFWNRYMVFKTPVAILAPVVTMCLILNLFQSSNICQVSFLGLRYLV